jgi:hypothetical protein
MTDSAQAKKTTYLADTAHAENTSKLADAAHAAPTLQPAQTAIISSTRVTANPLVAIAIYRALRDKAISIFCMLTGVILQHCIFNPSELPLDCHGEDLKQAHSRGPNSKSTNKSTGGDQTRNNANKQSGPTPAWMAVKALPISKALAIFVESA